MRPSHLTRSLNAPIPSHAAWSADQLSRIRVRHKSDGEPARSLGCELASPHWKVETAVVAAAMTNSADTVEMIAVAPQQIQATQPAFPTGSRESIEQQQADDR